MLRLALATTILLATPLAPAGGMSPAVFPDASNPPTSEPFRAVGGWGVAPDGGNVVMRLECSPFVLGGAGGHVTDATMRLAPRTTSGAVSATIINGEDQTNHENNQSQASVTAAVSGMGAAYFLVEVSVEDAFAPAGGYSTTIDATLTAL